MKPKNDQINKTPNHWCVCKYITCLSAPVQNFPPAWLSSWSHSLITHIFFLWFFNNLIFAFQALCQPPFTPPPFPRGGLPTCLPTLSFTIKSEKDAFRPSYEQQPPLRGFLRGGLFHCCHFRSAIRLSQHLISFLFFSFPPPPTPPADRFCRKNTGAASMQFQGRTMYTPFAGQAEAEASLLWVLPSPTVGRLLGERRCSAAPNFSSCALTY